ncbi:MAG: YidH family protein [Steroidobacteraceae bacterium]
MIQSYSDHAANERTFLAWVRTGIAVIAFGFVIEKFNLFVLTLASTAGLENRAQLARLSGSPGRYEGLAFIAGGIALIVLAALRFVRTTALIDDPMTHSARSVRTELILSAALVVLIAGYSIYLVFD